MESVELVENYQATLTERTGPNSAFGWDITVYDDVTIIQYWESDGKEKEIKDSFRITTGYDVTVFNAAIKMREYFDKEDK